MKKKIIFLILLIGNFLLISNCVNYTPIYAEQQTGGITFHAININAENEIKKMLLDLFNRSQKKNDDEKKYILNINVQKDKIIKTKDKTGEPVLYETGLTFDMEITSTADKKEIIYKKTIIENFYFKNLDSPSETADNENNLIKDYTRVAFSKISLAINQFSKNDL